MQFQTTGSLLFPLVLVLAGIVLIFLTIATMGPYFGFVLKTVLITQGCSSYCWAELTQSQGLACPLLQGGWGCPKWTQLGPNRMTRETSHATWHHAQHIKLGKEYGRGGHMQWCHLFSQITATCDDGALLCWRWLKHLPAHGEGWMNSLNCHYLNPRV